ncbi:hypothetical protein HELRODRAFT_133652, partial [Helobdella robusta]
LGEGEFGKVVMAKLKVQHSKNHTEIIDVAVKMLKDCTSAGEYRDLLSEFNLLQQVNHENVIRLIGVCRSPTAPLYIIVEFCKYGSLGSYLRKFRVNWRYSKSSDDDNNPDNSTGHGRCDLLKFCLHIASGMQYLNSMHIVHRDLAARNILVGENRIAKISDFGLSRDVYEGDAYFKTSKGPLPVRWMAPESLYSRTYTTMSDVWSYGIVLWEIITMGSNPYPGISCEKLMDLLKEGYRMKKPLSCSDELFDVISSCWNDDPRLRPSF